MSAPPEPSSGYPVASALPSRFKIPLLFLVTVSLLVSSRLMSKRGSAASEYVFRPDVTRMREESARGLWKGIAWQESLEGAFREARARGKPLFITFAARRLGQRGSPDL